MSHQRKAGKGHKPPGRRFLTTADAIFSVFKVFDALSELLVDRAYESVYAGDLVWWNKVATQQWQDSIYNWTKFSKKDLLVTNCLKDVTFAGTWEGSTIVLVDSISL